MFLIDSISWLSLFAYVVSSAWSSGFLASSQDLFILHIPTLLARWCLWLWFDVFDCSPTLFALSVVVGLDRGSWILDSNSLQSTHYTTWFVNAWKIIPRILAISLTPLKEGEKEGFHTYIHERNEIQKHNEI
jgi:hypothetical protein